MSNNDLVGDVSAELFWDPKVDNEAIAVSADDGQITLRGTVGSLREKREAKKAAERVFGVTSVDNQLIVRLMGDAKRDDAELRGDVLQALMLDSVVPSSVDAKVNDGYVTLTGTAEWKYQRDEAEHVASMIAGAFEVIDEIELQPHVSSYDVKDDIQKAMTRNAKLDAEDVEVSTSNGTVTLKGTVASWIEHDEAVDAAWAAPGVSNVRDLILVAY